MRPPAERLGERLAGIAVTAPAIPVLHNVTADRVDGPGAIREILARQLYSPVRWVETVQRMRSEGVRLCVECGPGKVLAGLGKRIERDMECVAVYDPAGLAVALEAANA